MRQGIERNSAAQIAAITCAGGVRLSVSSALALALGCSACGVIERAGDGAVRSWYLPLAVLVTLLRAGARRDTRRALSLALVLLGLGALAARAFDARGSDEGARAALEP